METWYLEGPRADDRRTERDSSEVQEASIRGQFGPESVPPGDASPSPGG
jgi:hypothetical protein